MSDRYQKIRDALAMGPTPGPWSVRYDYVVQAKSFDEGRLVPIAQPYGLRVDGSDLFANARLIAACDPDTIRALLEERDALAATLAATEAARDGYRDDAHHLHAALVRMVAQYESETDHEDTHKLRPGWLREALARTNALQEGGEGWEIEPETLDAAQQPAAVDGAIDKARFERAPCYMCGYNGPGYYQPDTHPCAAKYHAAQQGDER